MDVLPEGAEHFLVTLHARRFLGRRAVAVLVDGVQIASLDREDARRLANTVLEYQQNGLLAVAHAYYCMEESKPSLVVYADAEDKANRAVVAGTLTAASMGLSAVTAARAEAAEHANIHFFGSTNNQVAALMTSKTASTALMGSNIGLKLVAAASTAVIVGGGANFAASMFSVDKQEHEETAALQGESFDDSSFQDEVTPSRDTLGNKSHSSSSVATAPGTESRGGFRTIEEDSDSASNKNGHRNVATRIQAKAIEPTPEPGNEDVPQVTETAVVLPAPRTTAHRESETTGPAPSVEVTTAPRALCIPRSAQSTIRPPPTPLLRAANQALRSRLRPRSSRRPRREPRHRRASRKPRHRRPSSQNLRSPQARPHRLGRLQRR